MPDTSMMFISSPVPPSRFRRAWLTDVGDTLRSQVLQRRTHRNFWFLVIRSHLTNGWHHANTRSARLWIDKSTLGDYSELTGDGNVPPDVSPENDGNLK